MNFNLHGLRGMGAILDSTDYGVGLPYIEPSANFIDPALEIGMLTGIGTIPGQTLPSSGTAPRVPTIMGMPSGQFLLILAAIVAVYLLMKDKNETQFLR